MFKLTSQSFKDGQVIPKQYTGEGRDISPPLEWSNVPTETREFVLICEDPDAPQAEPWVHWIVFNLSPSITSLPEGIPGRQKLDLPVHAEQGENSFGSIGYGGPMPPVGHGPHRYFFKLYALNIELSIPPGADQKQLLAAMKSHVLAEAQLMGTYERGVKKKTA